MELSQFPMPRRGPEMKDSQKSMEILEAYDLFGSYNGSAKYCGCSPNTVKRLVQLRNAGELGRREQQQKRPKSIDKFFFLIEEAVDKSKGKIRADRIHVRLKLLGYPGSMRTTRRAVAKAKRAFKKANQRIYWPWIPEMGKWAQYDFSDGPVIEGKKSTLFHFYLPFSKVRIVRWIPDQSLPNVFMALDYCFRHIGGIPAYLLTDNAKTAAVNHIAGVAVINSKMVSFASAYGFSIQTCVVYDPASKGGVEAAVRVAKEDLCPRDTNFRDNYQSTADLIIACDNYTTQINSRVHSGSGEIPSAALEFESKAFHSLPQVPYLSVYGVMRKVEPKMAIVRFNNCGYSVPVSYRSEIVYVRSVGDQVVIVAQASPNGHVSEIARHMRGAPYSYVIDKAHKAADHPSGPLVRRPIPTSSSQGKFLAISSDASNWLIEACNSGASGIEESIEILSSISDKQIAARVISTSLQLSNFNYLVIKDLIAVTKYPNSTNPNKAEVVANSSYCPPTSVWSALSEVS